MPALSVRNLSFNYNETPILKDINISVTSGGFTIILGKNGSGKSTLLKLVAGLLDSDRGSIDIFGKDLTRLSLPQRARLIGFLPQFHRPVFPFTVFDVVLTGRAGYVNLIPKKQDRRAALASIQRVGIEHLTHRPFTELSGGEQQMVMIARVLAQEPRIILLDEPTAHLDFFNQVRILNLIKKFVATDLTVISVLHDPNIAFLYGDYFIFLKDGKIFQHKDNQNPWDVELLSAVYDTPLCAVPYQGRALIVPRMTASVDPSITNLC